MFYDRFSIKAPYSHKRTNRHGSRTSVLCSGGPKKVCESLYPAPCQLSCKLDGLNHNHSNSTAKLASLAKPATFPFRFITNIPEC